MMRGPEVILGIFLFFLSFAGVGSAWNVERDAHARLETDLLGVATAPSILRDAFEHPSLDLTALQQWTQDLQLETRMATEDGVVVAAMVSGTGASVEWRSNLLELDFDLDLATLEFP